MKTIVIDANIAVSFVVNLDYSKQSLLLYKSWRAEKVQFIVPKLWRYEVLSALRKSVFHNLIKEDEALNAYATLLAFSFELVEDPDVPAILSWAERIRQPVAYDAVYLALCEAANGEFWTADIELANAAIQAGATWVHRLTPEVKE